MKNCLATEFKKESIDKQIKEAEKELKKSDKELVSQFLKEREDHESMEEEDEKYNKLWKIRDEVREKQRKAIDKILKESLKG